MAAGAVGSAGGAGVDAVDGFDAAASGGLDGPGEDVAGGEVGFEIAVEEDVGGDGDGGRRDVGGGDDVGGEGGEEGGLFGGS